MRKVFVRNFSARENKILERKADTNDRNTYLFYVG